MYTPAITSLKKINIITNSMVLILVMTLIGLWHGPTWGFIIFGLLHGIGLSLNHLFRSFNLKLNSILSIAFTFIFVNISLIFFKYQNINDAISLLYSMFTYNPSTDESSLFNYVDFYKSCLFLLPLSFMIIFFTSNTSKLYSKFKPKNIWVIIPIALLTLVISA